MASTMYGTPMVSSVMPNPMGTPMMSTVMPNPMSTPVMSTVMPNPMGGSSTGVQGLPMSSALPIIVNENTPNLAEIQSFPVIVRGNGIHMHQDPVSGQRYRMDDTFHARIPEILRSRETQPTFSDEALAVYDNQPVMNNGVRQTALSSEIDLSSTRDTFNAIFGDSLRNTNIRSFETVGAGNNRTSQISTQQNMSNYSQPNQNRVMGEQDILRMMNELQNRNNSVSNTNLNRPIVNQFSRLSEISSQASNVNQFPSGNTGLGQPMKVSLPVNRFSTFVNTAVPILNEPQFSLSVNSFSGLSPTTNTVQTQTNRISYPVNFYHGI